MSYDVEFTDLVNLQRVFFERGRSPIDETETAQDSQSVYRCLDMLVNQLGVGAAIAVRLLDDCVFHRVAHDLILFTHLRRSSIQMQNRQSSRTE